MEYEIINTQRLNDIKKAFRYWVKCGHRNLITPDLISLKSYKDYVVEVAQGRGMENNILYGVTIFKYDEKQKGFYGLDIPTEIKDLSECFNNKTDAFKRRDLMFKKLSEVAKC